MKYLLCVSLSLTYTQQQKDNLPMFFCILVFHWGSFASRGPTGRPGGLGRWPKVMTTPPAQAATGAAA